MVKGSTKLAIGIVTYVIAAFAYAAQIQVQVDRNPVEEDESFILEFTAHEEVDGSPDFSPLEEDFRVISRNQSSNLQIINGNVSRETKWSLVMMPKHPGKINIPAIAFGDDHSAAKVLTVKQTNRKPGVKGASKLSIEVDVDRKTAYIQSQILCTIRIYSAVELLNASLSELKLNDDNAIIEKAGDDVTYEKRINGRRYKVYEKYYAIFPQKSGQFTITPIKFEGQYLRRRLERRIKRLESDPIKLTIKPKPADPQLQNVPWLPARNMQLKETWPQEPPEFKVGEPVTRTITLVADGLFASQLPQLKMGQVNNMKQYPDKPLLEDNKAKSGIVGKREEKIALIPTKTGRHVIPAIKIPWWNIEKDKLEYLQIPKREIMVQPGASLAQQGSQNPLAEDPAKLETLNASSEDGASESDHVQQNPQPAGVANYWQWIGIVALAGWLLTAGAWWASRTRKVKYTEHGRYQNRLRSKPDCTSLLKPIKAAVDKNDAMQAKSALLQWGLCFWPDSPPASLGEMARLCKGPLREHIQFLNKCLYSGQNLTWNGSGLWDAVQEYQQQAFTQQEAGSDVIAPLHQTVMS
jgi:hypothetical protein